MFFDCGVQFLVLFFRKQANIFRFLAPRIALPRQFRVQFILLFCQSRADGFIMFANRGAQLTVPLPTQLAKFLNVFFKLIAVLGKRPGCFLALLRGILTLLFGKSGKLLHIFFPFIPVSLLTGINTGGLGFPFFPGAFYLFLNFA